MIDAAKNGLPNRLVGLRREVRPGLARPDQPVRVASPRVGAGIGAAWGLLERDLVPAPAPRLDRAEYRYRLGVHGLILSAQGVTRRHEAAVGRAEAEFALLVEGPVLVFGSRFGKTRPWSWAAPYHWHFTHPTERVVPAALPLTPETFARLWATLWITLVDSATGRIHARRAVALHPKFTQALHAALRDQALRPFPVEAAERALDRLRVSAVPPEPRLLARARCAAVTEEGGGWLTTRAGRDDLARNISMRKYDVSRIRHLDHHL